MTIMNVLIITIAFLSIALQAWAVIMALRLIRITTKGTAWGLIAAGLALMAVRRMVPLYCLIAGDVAEPLDIMNGLVGLMVSVFIAGGISYIASLFLERKQVENALRMASAEIEDLYDHAPCGYHSVDPDGVFIRMNDTELAWLGYARDEIIGKMKLSDILTAKSLEIFRTSFPVFKERGWVKDLEFEFVRKDGSILPVLVSATAIFDRDGGFLMSRSTVYDMTERKRAEEAFRKSELKYRIVSDNTYDWEYWQAPDGRFEYISPSCERITGHAAGEFLQDPGLLRSIIHPDDRERFDRHLSERHDKRIISEIAYRVVRPDGAVRWIDHVCQPVFNAAGEFLGMRSSNRDSTDRKKAEEAIRKLNEELEERVKQRTAELERRNYELEQMNKVFVGRELRMAELKEKLRKLEGS